MGKLLIHNGKLVTPSGIIESGAVYISSGTIEDIGLTRELEKRYQDGISIDANGAFVAPGLINLHTHLYSAFARWIDFSCGRPAKFVDILKNIWWKLDSALTHEDVYFSALIGLIDAVRCGTTTVIDHHASPNCVAGSLEKIEEALSLLPVRASLCYEVSDRDGEKIAFEGIEENARFIKSHLRSELLTALFGMHASFTISDKTLKKCADTTDKLGVGIHVHTAEDRADTDDCRKRCGTGVIERWRSHGLLGPKSLLVHCIHIDDAEKEVIAGTRTNIAFNPQSNAHNNVGAADIKGMLAKGAMAGLGTDGMTMDMFEESGFLKRKGMQYEAEKLLFKNNSDVVSALFGWRVGRLEKGFAADIIIADKLDSGGVRTTIVGGKVLMEDGKIMGIDEERITAKAHKLAKELQRRI